MRHTYETSSLIRVAFFSFLPMKLEFHPYGTRVSPVWNWSFSHMELECQWGLALEFHPYGTRTPSEFAQWELQKKHSLLLTEKVEECDQLLDKRSGGCCFY